MNSVFRSISHLKRTSNHHRRLLLSLHSHFSTTKPTKPKATVIISSTSDSPLPSSPSPADWARPSEIPFQAKVANSVHLIGYVRSPVRFHTTPDGSSWASTVLTQNLSSSSDDDHGGDGVDEAGSPDSLPLWVPIMFEGNLANIAASHLKENDRVYVTGQLSASLPCLNANQVQASVQVMAHDLHFIDESVKPGQRSVLYKQEKGTWNSSDHVYKDELDLSSWKDLLKNPKQWWDNRDRKRNRSVSPKYPDFTHKDDRHGLWLNSAPRSVLIELEGLQFDAQVEKPKEVKQFKDKDVDSACWRDLIDNSEQWLDYRSSKLDGLVKPKHPDFKRKDGSHALWLASAPECVLSQLEGLKFDAYIQKPKAVGGASSVKANKDELWKDLVENPGKWWDNRLTKLKEKAPDFKHKETGEALWLDGSPTWVLPKLLPPKSKEDASFREKDSLLS